MDGKTPYRDSVRTDSGQQETSASPSGSSPPKEHPAKEHPPIGDAESPRLVEIATPIMARLAARTRETVILGRRFGRSIVVLSVVKLPDTEEIGVETGMVFPVYAGAYARAVLAFLPEAESDQILLAADFAKLSDNTITDRAEMRRRLEQVRRVGYAGSHGEVRSNLAGVSAPIHSRSDQVRAVLTLGAPANRLPPERYSEVGPLLVIAAEEISYGMGWI